MLAPLVALLSLENGLRDEIRDDPLPPENMIGPLPCWALDMFTREGRAALAKILQNDAGIRQWSCDTLPVAGRVEMLAQALFRVESGMCAQRKDGPVGQMLREMMELECMGLAPDQVATLLGLVNAAIPRLNIARTEVMGAQPDA